MDINLTKMASKNKNSFGIICSDIREKIGYYEILPRDTEEEFYYSISEEIVDVIIGNIMYIKENSWRKSYGNTYKILEPAFGYFDLSITKTTFSLEF